MDKNTRNSNALLGYVYATLGSHDMTLLNLATQFTSSKNMKGDSVDASGEVFVRFAAALDRLAEQQQGKLSRASSAGVNSLQVSNFMTLSGDLIESDYGKSWKERSVNLRRKSSRVLRDFSSVAWVVRTFSRLSDFRTDVVSTCVTDSSSGIEWGCAAPEMPTEPSLSNRHTEMNGRLRNALLSYSALKVPSRYMRDMFDVWSVLCNSIPTSFGNAVNSNTYTWSSKETTELAALQCSSLNTSLGSPANWTRQLSLTVWTALLMTKISEAATVYNAIFDLDSDGIPDFYSLGKHVVAGGTSIIDLVRIELATPGRQNAGEISALIDAKRFDILALIQHIDAVMTSDLPLTVVKNIELSALLLKESVLIADLQNAQLIKNLNTVQANFKTLNTATAEAVVAIRSMRTSLVEVDGSLRDAKSLLRQIAE